MSQDREAFVGELKRWRDVRGLSQARLARAMGYDRSYISKVENGTDWPAVDFARRADEVLAAGGALRRAYSSQAAGPRSNSGVAAGGVAADTSEPAALVVDHDEATLYYDNGAYRASQHRRIVNHGTAPVSRYLIRISVDRFPGSPERSNELYRANPLTWEELRLEAFCGDEPMRWAVQHDRDAFKELRLLFENDDAASPSTRARARTCATPTASARISGGSGSNGPCDCPPGTSRSGWTSRPSCSPRYGGWKRR